LENYSKEQPYLHATSFLYNSTTTYYWTNKDRLIAIEDIDFDDIVAYRKRMLKSLRFSIYAHGNILKNECIQIGKNIEEILNAKTSLLSEYIKKRVTKTKKGIEHVISRKGFNTEDSNSCVYNWYVVGDRNDLFNESCLKLLGELLTEPCFTQLRTQEQLGYIVWSKSLTNANISGYRIIVQSSKYDANYLNDRTENFIQNAKKILEDLAVEEFDKTKHAVAVKIAKKNDNYRQNFQEFWEEIYGDTYLYKRRFEIANIVKTLTKEHILTFFHRYVYDISSRRKFSSRAFGKDSPVVKTEQPHTIHIENEIEFKSNTPLFKSTLTLN